MVHRVHLAVLPFAAGILWVQQSAQLPAWPLWLTVSVVAGAAIAALAGSTGDIRQPGALPAHRFVSVLLLLAAFCAGVAWSAWRAEQRLADRLDEAWEGRDVVVSGVVVGLPNDFGRGEGFEFAVDTVSTAGAVVPRRLQLNWYRPAARADVLPELQPGQRWQFTVRLKRPHGGVNVGGFDYEAWLLGRGIRATGYVRPGPAALLAATVWQPEALIARSRAAVRTHFERALPAADHPWRGILVALAIGDQRAIDGGLWTVFNKTGVTHLLSVSGLHVTLVAGLFGAAVGSLWRRVPALVLRWPAQKAGLLAAGAMALCYSLLAGFGVPAQRTLYMLWVALAALLAARNVAADRVWALALGVVLVFDPWSVLAPGFWLSFLAVGALLYIGKAQRETGGWRRQLRAFGAVQWAATLVTLPVLLFVFQQFSLVSPLANALAVPLVSFVVTPLALLGAVIPWDGVLIAAHWLLDLLMRFLFWCADWPLWQAAPPPVWSLLPALVGVVLALAPSGVPVKGLGFALLLPLLFWPGEGVPFGEARIDVLDVGQGQAVVVRTANRVLVYDPGPRYSPDADAGQRVLLPFLRAQGVDRIDRLIVSHADADHAGGLAALQSVLPVGDLLSSEAGIGRACLAGEGWRWDGVEFALLHPAVDDADLGKNDRSCVLSVRSSGQRVLLVGDIEAAAEARLAARGDDLKADLLLVPHHGARTSSSVPFVLAVDPAHAVFSVGYRNRFGHPHPGVVDRYEAVGARLWRTDRDGALQLAMRPDGLQVAARREVQRRYWHGR